VEQTVNWLQENAQPDLIFMDIQLEDGICFEIFEKVGLKAPVIFTTAYDEYALRAFKVNSIDYLLKPLNSEMLMDAIQRYRDVFARPDYFSRMESLMNQLQPASKERFLIKIGDHFKSVQTKDVTCFYIRERCNFIATYTGKNYPVDYSLDKIGIMVDNRRFFRVNRNFIVNFHFIHDVVAYSSSRLKIVVEGWSDEEIVVSRDRVNEFKIWMDR
jgi:DNA-binding LytR/AlgR family response regulator